MLMHPSYPLPPLCYGRPHSRHLPVFHPLPYQIEAQSWEWLEVLEDCDSDLQRHKKYSVIALLDAMSVMSLIPNVYLCLYCVGGLLGKVSDSPPAE